MEIAVRLCGTPKSTDEVFNLVLQNMFTKWHSWKKTVGSDKTIITSDN